jgi:autotransporter-associated beta strand protein
MNRTRKVERGLGVGLVVALTTLALSAQAATVGSRFDPSDYADDGALTVTSGSLYFDTDNLTNSATGTGGFLVTNESDKVVMAMFNFTSVGISNGVTVTVSGNRGLVIGSQGDISIDTTVSVAGVDSGDGPTLYGDGGPGADYGLDGVGTNCFSQGPEKGRGGPGTGTSGDNDGWGYGGGSWANVNGDAGAGEGAGYGGAGGANNLNNKAGGLTYGDAALTDLLGGSGGAGGRHSKASKMNSAAGGGGAIELTANGTITIGANGTIDASGGSAYNNSGGRRNGGGGSGGGILLNAPAVTVQPGGTVDASGGNGGYNSTTESLSGGDGGGGRIAIYATTLTMDGTATVDPGSNAGAGIPAAVTGSYYTTYYIGPIVLSPSTHAFGSKQVNTTNDFQYLVVTNSGAVPLSTTNFVWQDGGTNVFSLYPDTNPTGTVAAGSSTNLTVRYIPTNGTSHAATLQIWSDAGNTNPALFTVTGTGASETPTSVIQVAQSSLNFSTIDSYTTSNLTVVVSNDASATKSLIITNYSYTGSNTFTVISPAVGDLPVPIPVGSSSNFVVQYAPVGSVASHSGQVQILSDAANQNPTNIAVQGVCQAGTPVIGVTPASPGVVEAQTNTVSNLTFTVSNNGTGLLTGSAGGLAAPFSFVGGTAYSLPAGTSTNVTVQFAPTTEGVVSDTVTFTDGGGSNVTVTGKGYVHTRRRYTGGDATKSFWDRNSNWSPDNPPDTPGEAAVFDGDNDGDGGVAMYEFTGLTIGQIVVLSPDTANAIYDVHDGGDETLTLQPGTYGSAVGVDMSLATTNFTFDEGSRRIYYKVSGNQRWDITSTEAAGDLIVEGPNQEVDLQSYELTLNVGSGRTVDLDAEVVGTGSLVVTNAGTVTMGHAANDYSGGTVIDSGTLQLTDNNDVLPTAGAVSFTGAGTLDLNDLDQEIASLSSAAGGTNDLGTGTLTVNQSGNTTFNGTFTGDGSLVKTNSGALTLSGSSTHTGGTAVDGGTLIVSGSLGDTPVTIGAGGTLDVAGTIGDGSVTVASGGALTGTGTIGGVVTNSGTIDLDSDTTTATLTVSNLVLNASSVVEFDLDDGASDTIAVSGSVTDSATVTLNFTDIGLVTVPQTNSLITGSSLGLTTNNFTTGPLPGYNLTLTNQSGNLQVIVTASLGDPDIDIVTPSPVNFGVVLTNAYRDIPVVISNLGPVTLNVTNFTFDIAGEFTNASPTGAVGIVESFSIRYAPTNVGQDTVVMTVWSDDPDTPSTNITLTGYGAVSHDLLATNAGATLSIDTDSGQIEYVVGALTNIYTATIANHTATWILGDLAIGSNLTAFTYSGTNAMKFVANGLGYAGQGDISIQQGIDLDGADGAGDSTEGGGGAFGSGSGGGDGTYAGHGESAASDAYTRHGIGGGRDSNGGSGGAFGGGGGMSQAGVVGGSAYGRLDLAHLGAAVGPVGGSGGGGGDWGSAGAGGGAIQFIAVDDVTIDPGVVISANGGQGHGSGFADYKKQSAGGGGAGGGILLIADSDRDGDGTLTHTGATLSAAGGISYGDPAVVGTAYGGDGGGGRVALSGAAVVGGGTVTVAGGNHGTNGGPGEDGSVLTDARAGTLSLSGGGLGANSYDSYTSLSVSSSSTLAVGDTNAVGTLTVSNAATVTILGTLAMDADSGGATADRLIVTGALDITSTTLDIDAIGTLDDDLYILADYGSLTGVFAATSGVPANYTVNYDLNAGSQIALVATDRDIDLESLSIEFSLVATGLVKTVTQEVYNVGLSSNLVISGISTNGSHPNQFSVVSYDAVIAPGATGEVVVSYHPDAIASHTGRLDIASNDPDEGIVSVTLLGEGIDANAGITVPASVDFGRVTVGGVRTVNLSVGNTGGSVDLTVSGVSTSGTDSAQITVLSSFPIVVGPGGSSNIVVRYQPTNVTASLDATLAISHNGVEISPTNVPLTGTAELSETTGSRLDPGDFDSLGDLTLTNGESIVFDTDTDDLTYAVNGVTNSGGVLVTNDSGKVVMALFNFDSVDIGTNVEVTVNGNLGLVLGSLGSLTLDDVIQVNGGDGTRESPGSGAPGAEGGVRETSFTSNPPDGNRGDGGDDGPANTRGIGYGAGEDVDDNTAGGGGAYGGNGGELNADKGGHSYGDLMLADLLGGSGGSGGDNSSDWKDSAGGGGGGTIELAAVGALTLEPSGGLQADGGSGGNLMTGDKNKRTGGGGSGGGLLLTAPTIDIQAGSVVSVNGGSGGDKVVAGTRGGVGGGGRIAIYTDNLTWNGTITSDMGSEGATNSAQDGTIFIEVPNTLLYISGPGTATNLYASYTSLTITNGAALALEGAGIVGALGVSNTFPVVIDGTLAIDLDWNASGCDILSATNDIFISADSTLDLNEMVAPPIGLYITVIQSGGTINGTFGEVTWNEDAYSGYTIRYTPSEVQVSRRRPPGAVFIIR